MSYSSLCLQFLGDTSKSKLRCQIEGSRQSLKKTCVLRLRPISKIYRTESDMEPQSVLSASDVGMFSLVFCMQKRERERRKIWRIPPVTGGSLLTLEEGVKEHEPELEEHDKGPRVLF